MEKINIAELLKDCPQGMELDCALYENLEFDHIEECSDNFIVCRVKTESGYNIHTFTKYGCYSTNNYAKCVIYPKGKTTWEGFVPPYKFNDGDILVHSQNQRFIMSIYHKAITELVIKTHCILWDKEEGLSVNKQICCYADSTRLATEEEKQKLFDAIKENGYRWNDETKTLEKMVKPKFKVGDRIKNKNSGTCDKVIEIFKDCYLVESCFDKQATIDFDIQDNWELFPDKFDITTLKPFESKVLVRDKESHKWKPAIWGFYDEDSFGYNNTVVGGHGFNCCIPYEENQHLLGTSDDCDSYYKNWEE